MRCALFVREFRTALVPNLVTVGAILGTLAAVERLYGLRLGKAEDVQAFIDVALLVGLVVSGFISGERCFPAEVKESRILFFSSLPISRRWAWLAIVSARLVAALASLTLVVALRRPLLESADLTKTGISLVAALVLGAYILFFFAGTLFALLFRRTFFSYIAGFLVLSLLLIETLFSTSYSMLAPQLSMIALPPALFWQGSRFPPFLVVFLSVLLLSSLFLSWRFFVLGEISNPKRRGRNQILSAIIATAYLGIAFCVVSSTAFAAFGSIRGAVNLPNALFVRKTPPFNLSPDGRLLFVFESSNNRPFLVRVNIVDTGSGHVIGRSVYGGAGWGFWSDPGYVLNPLVINNSPLDRWGYLIQGSVDWIRISPRGREVSRLRLKGVEEVKTLVGGRALVVLREGNLGKILLLDGASGLSAEIARAPLDGKVVADQDGKTALVFFENVVLPSRAWVIDSGAREVRVPRTGLRTSSQYVLFGEAFGSSEEAQAELLRRFGLPPEREGAAIRGSFLLPPYGRPWILAESDAAYVYFLEERAPDSEVLWTRSTAPQGQWKGSRISLPKREPSTSLRGSVPSFL
jgi:hypothetical protein